MKILEYKKNNVSMPVQPIRRDEKYNVVPKDEGTNNSHMIQLCRRYPFCCGRLIPGNAGVFGSYMVSHSHEIWGWKCGVTKNILENNSYFKCYFF